MTQTRVTDLVLDFSIYPRHQIDAQHVRDLVNALEAGVNLPPVRADRKSKRVIDGFHRIKAYLQHLGDLAVLEVSWRDYTDESALLLEAIQLNAQHGRKLSAYDRARCIVLAEAQGITAERIAGVLGLTVDRLERLGLRKIAFDAAGSAVPIKETLRPFAQSRLSREQLLGNKRAGGGRQLWYINQVVNLIETDIFDESNPRLVKRLRHLIAIASALVAKLEGGERATDAPAA